MIKTNTRIFHNSISNEFQRVTRDAEHYSNVYINNYQNVANKPLRYMDSTELKAVLSNPNTNAHFTELTSVFASTFLFCKASNLYVSAVRYWRVQAIRQQQQH